jgi:hypothetical protein
MCTVSRSRPHGGWLVALVALMVAPVVAHQLGAPGVGAFSMFTEIREMRLRIRTGAPPRAPEPMSVRTLVPHLGRDARRVLAGADRFGPAETQVELLASGLDDVARLVCAVRPLAARAEVVLEVRRPGHTEVALTRHVEECAGVR